MLIKMTPEVGLIMLSGRTLSCVRPWVQCPALPKPNKATCPKKSFRIGIAYENATFPSDIL